MADLEDDRKPFPSPWTDAAERPTPYDPHTASVEARHAGVASRRFPRAVKVVFFLAILFIVAVFGRILTDPPWDDTSAAELGVVSEAEARETFERMVTVASERTPGAMERLCEMAVDNCNGLSGAVNAHPDSAPGRDAPAPEVLCSHDLDDEGARLLVAEGEDGFGRPYVSQLVFTESGGDVVLEREPGFWLGVVHHGSKYTGSVGWTTMHHPQEDVQTGNNLDELIKQARAPCMDR